MTDKWLKPKEVAEMTGLTTRWIRELIHREEFPKPVKLSPGPNGRLRFPEHAVVDWMKSRESA